MAFLVGLPWTPLPLPQSLYGRTYVRAYADVRTKISRIDMLPNSLTNGALLSGLRPQRSSAINANVQGPVVQRVENAIHRMNRYPADK